MTREFLRFFAVALECKKRKMGGYKTHRKLLAFAVESRGKCEGFLLVWGKILSCPKMNCFPSCDKKEKINAESDLSSSMICRVKIRVLRGCAEAARPRSK